MLFQSEVRAIEALSDAPLGLTIAQVAEVSDQSGAATRSALRTLEAGGLVSFAGFRHVYRRGRLSRVVKLTPRGRRLACRIDREMVAATLAARQKKTSRAAADVRLADSPRARATKERAA